MTREEIIDELCRLRSDIVVAGGYVNRTDAQKNRFAQALSEGILRLQTEPCEDTKDALHIVQTDRDKWKARAKKLAKIIGIRDCDIDQYKQELCEYAISRQAARECFDMTNTRPGAKHAIETLPPVQPAVLMAKIHTNADSLLERLRKQIDFAKLGIIVPNETLEPIPNVIRCKDCKWFGHPGCAIEIVDDSDRPKENDFCSFAERKEN